MALESLGPYRIERLLGRGGMGTVYIGVHRETDARVAIKVLTASLAADPHFQERFATEVATLKKLRHQNIVELYGYGEQEGNLFYTMELVDGRSLQEELSARRVFLWREVARIGIEICAALKHAHDRGVIHRDLKPANLLLTRDETVKLLDFGIAKLFGATQMTAAGGVIGTADYMAPEQAEGRPITVRSDLYSLGSVLYALLAGRPPFHAKTLPEVIHAVRFEEPVALRRLVPDAPQEMEQIISQLLAKDPDQRIATALSVSNRLKAMEHALSIETRIEEPPEGKTRVPQADDAGDTRDDLVGEDSSERPTHAVTAARPTLELDDDIDAEYRISEVDETLLSEPGQSTSSRSDSNASSVTSYTTVDAGQLAKEERRDGQDDNPWWFKPLIAVLMIVVVLGMVIGIWTATRPTSADRLYGQIAASADEAESLVAVKSEMDQFQEYYASDPRNAEVALWQRDLESYRLQRKLERQARRVGGAAYLNLIEQGFLGAMRAKRNDLNDARRRFELLLRIFSGRQQQPLSSDQEECLELARHELKRLKQPTEQPQVDNSARLLQRLTWAEQNLEDEELAEFRKAVIGLYENEPWAADVVRRCRESLLGP